MKTLPWWLVPMMVVTAAAPTYAALEDVPFEIRPGMFLGIKAPHGESGTVCTSNFVFRAANASSGDWDYLLGTAGHCARGGVGSRVSLGTNGVPLRYIGRVNYQHLEGGGAVGYDFALVKVLPELASYVNPALCHWGGPTGLYEEWPVLGEERWTLTDGAEIRYYGWGALNDPAYRPREGKLVREEHDVFEFIGNVNGGDSGSPIIRAADGLALGLEVASFSSGTPAPYVPALAWAHNLAVELGQAEAVLGFDLELMTAPLKIPPSPDAACGGSNPDWLYHPPNMCDLAILPDDVNAACNDNVPENVRDPPP